jgi:hypothetical protein
MNDEANLSKTQTTTLAAIRNLPADAPHGRVKPGVSYAGIKAYKGVNAAAVHVLVARGLLVLGADGTVTAV